jgi:UrcA family protein
MTAKTSNRIRFPLGRAAVLAACVLSGSLSIAQAAPPAADDVPTVVVAYGDLDLNTQDGVHTLYNRISAAASRVCPFQEATEPERVAYFKSCRDAAITRAVSQLKIGQLAALHAEHVKRG